MTQGQVYDTSKVEMTDQSPPVILVINNRVQLHVQKYLYQ